MRARHGSMTFQDDNRVVVSPRRRGGMEMRRARAPAAAFVGPLDGHTAGLLGAWSVARRLLSSHTGPLIRVRRSSDDAEMDFGALADGALDVAALLAFCGASHGYLVRVYDEYGVNNMDQPDPSIQPRVVVSGVLVTMSGGAPGVSFSTGTQFMLSTLPAIEGAATVLCVVHDVASNSRFCGTDQTEQNHLFYNAPLWRSEARFVGTSQGVTGSGSGRVSFKQANATTRRWQLDGGAEQEDDSGPLDNTFGVRGWFCTSFGSGPAVLGTGKINEMIIYSAALSESDVQAIQATQGGLT